MFGAFIGASAGLFVRVWANALGKQHPLARKPFCNLCICKPPLIDFILFVYYLGPWNHVLFGAVGGYVGYNYSRWEQELLVSVNALRKQKGMPEITRESVIPHIPQPEI